MNRIEILGVWVDLLSPMGMLERYEEFLGGTETRVVHHLSVHPIIEARGDRTLSAALVGSDLNLPDGIGVTLAARVLGANRLPERIPGTDAMIEVLRWGTRHHLRHAFVGGSTSTLMRLRERLTSAVPDALLVSMTAPPHRDVSEATVLMDLEAVDRTADVIWVGIGTPKQQKWAHIAAKHSAARIIATTGAAFEFLAGVKPRAPSWVRRAGLEWAFRLTTEPRRLWRRYLLGNPRFLWHVARQRRFAGRR